MAVPFRRWLAAAENYWRKIRRRWWNYFHPGFAPWILVDFRSPKRVVPGIQDGFNRKGLISSDGAKKKAFYVLQNYYRQRAAAAK